jgi:mono/diheme cytochrome c family protein
LLVALFVGVTLVVAGIARWQPFEPEAPAAVVAAGDAVHGEAVFAATCAGCHGTGGAGGGVGPRLVGAELSAPEVAAVVAAGRGIMPAGLAQGADAADVAAYVAGISGGQAAGTPPASTAPQAVTGRAALTGPRLGGLAVRLDAPATGDWTVWIEGSAGRREAGTIPAGERTLTAPAAAGGGSILDGYDRVLVGTAPEDAVLSGTLAPDRAEALRRLFVGDPSAPGGAPLLATAAGQIAILREHVGFLAAARDAGYLPNVRFHGEHMVNLTRGTPLQDVDGNGDASNPGDGVGLIDGPGAYLVRVPQLVGATADADGRRARADAGLIAARGLVCGRAGSVAGAVPSIDAIQRAAAHLAGAWAGIRAAARRSAVIPLEPA